MFIYYRIQYDIMILVIPVQIIIERLLIPGLINKLQLDTGTNIFNQHSSKRHKEKANFIFWNIAFFSLIQSVTASGTDKSYSSHEDVFDGLLNTLFPISFVILFKSSKESESIRNTLLPLLDDILYSA